MKTTSDQGIGGDFSFADEGMAFENFDSCGSSQYGGEEGRMRRVGGTGEWRVEGKEAGARTVQGVFFRD
jgi:hypothetical protein